MFAPLLTFVALFVSPVAVRASPCVAFDTNWNLLAFGLDGKDYNAGTQDTWASGTFLRLAFNILFKLCPSSKGTATDITASGRP